MFSHDDIKGMPENSFMRPGDEIISIHEVCLNDNFQKRDFSLLPPAGKLELDVPRALYQPIPARPGLSSEGHGSVVSELDRALKNEPDTSTSVLGEYSPSEDDFSKSSFLLDPQLVSSTSTTGPTSLILGPDKAKKESTKVDKSDPRSRFHFVKYVKRHGRTVKIWECGLCNREFQHQYTLIRHVPTHTDERNFHCGACGKSFRQLSTLSQHKAIHSADRPYACEMCKKTFNRVSTLISHRKTHSNDKPYKCDRCPKGFHQKGNLRNHMFTHTNERPYRCSVCNKGFNQQSNLVCHKNKAHCEDLPNIPPEMIAPKAEIPRPSRSPRQARPDSTVSKPEQCEVSSSVGPYLSTIEGPSTSSWHSISPSIIDWEVPRSYQDSSDIWTMSGLNGGGVIVEPIKTFHMGVAMATKQTPFALLKPDHGVPVLVKVVDTKLPGGKQQMLVPATADDLRFGGKVTVNNDGESLLQHSSPAQPSLGVQIRVPVVATVAASLRGGGLQLAVQEPHQHFHTALNATVEVEGCSLSSPPHSFPAETPGPHLEPPPLTSCPNYSESNGNRASSSCALFPPAPSPPLDLISLDLFEHMECIPMGSQVTSVDDHPSDDSSVLIGQFQDSIALSDSD
ncbi:hypothetical protein JYU34_010312 [Plutella xylostella]|uniref:C2H2-type domain-containing protein n=1 Tax=Plutella xylostella TaxID=51655 RepID=A0ABQ7QI96_PLUXY|nr:hypothetical protein JYU34_010312 [Plutella xylostella]